MASTTPVFIESVDEMIITLENDPVFYAQWLAYAQSCVSHFFQVHAGRHGLETAYTIPDPQSYFTPKNWTDNIYQRIKTFIHESHARLHLSHSSGLDMIEWTACYFAIKLTQSIQSGEIGLPEGDASALAVIYRENTTKAQASRETGLSAHRIKTLIISYPADLYRRYMAVQQGTPYNKVMGDCAPYAHTYPKYNPKRTLQNNCNGHIQPGDLIAAFGSSHFYTVGSVYNATSPIHTTKGWVIHYPLHHIPKEHAGFVGAYSVG